jgi:hypothetical protein
MLMDHSAVSSERVGSTAALMAGIHADSLIYTYISNFAIASLHSLCQLTVKSACSRQ